MEPVLLGNIVWYNAGELTGLLLRFFFNLMVITILVKGIYFNYKKDKEYAFTFFVFNILIFFVCYIFSNTDIPMGFAFGLFAVFGILRYRTSTIPIKEMTYLFTAISVALINALQIEGFSVSTLALVNVFILLTVFTMEKIWFGNRSQYRNIYYEKIELIQEGKKDELLKDLRHRTNLHITDYEIKSVNFLNDSVELRVFFIPKN